VPSSTLIALRTYKSALDITTLKTTEKESGIMAIGETDIFLIGTIGLV